MAHKDKPLIKDVLEDLVTTILDCTPEELVEMYPKLEMFSTEIKLRIDEL